jgi:hypothetical protein
MKCLLVGLLGLLISAGVFAEDEPVTIDGKHILVTDVTEPGFYNKQIHSSIFNGGGAYIIAGSVNQRFPSAEKAIAEIFKSHGIPVADSLETSSVAMVFTTWLALDMANADQMAAHVHIPNAAQIATEGTQMLGAVMVFADVATGVAVALAGFAAELLNTDTKLVISVSSYKKPVYRHGQGGTSIGTDSKDSDAMSYGLAKIYYKLEFGKEASDDVVLKMAVDQWIKHYVIFDSPTLEAAAPKAAVAQIPAVVPTPAPSVSPVSTVVSDVTSDNK